MFQYFVDVFFPQECMFHYIDSIMLASSMDRNIKCMIMPLLSCQQLAKNSHGKNSDYAPFQYLGKVSKFI